MTAKRDRGERYGRKNAFCYVIAPIEGTPCKVGVTYDLKERLATLQCGNWNKLSVHGSLLFASMIDATHIESLALRALDVDGRRVSGDWFNRSAPYVMRTLHKLCATHRVALIKPNKYEACRMAARIMETIRTV